MSEARPLKVWLVTVGEPLPTDGNNERLLRAGLLAESLVSCGHVVTWWTSSFDHVRKRHRCSEDTTVALSDRYRIIMLRSLGYRTNVSVRRIIDHRNLARKFLKASAHEERPDVVFCSWPPIEIGEAVTRYGRDHGVPTVLDVRDLWPDALVDLAPVRLRGAARLVLAHMFRSTRAAFRDATAVTGVTMEFVDWGLGYAGRGRRDVDRDFPTGYKMQKPGEAALADADAYWDSRGVVGCDSEFVVCFFGTIGKQFDFGTVFEAARKLAKGERRIRFVLCGTGDNVRRYERLAGELPNVMLPGWVGQAEISSLMRRSAAGLAPYNNTTDFLTSLPNKPIEYMSAGLPVVSGLGGVLGDLVRKHSCGVVYPEGDSEALAAALVDLYDLPTKRASLARNAHELFKSRFVAERVYEGLGRYLAELARPQTGSTPIDASNRAWDAPVGLRGDAEPPGASPVNASARRATKH